MNKEIENILIRAESQCSMAVSHVGAANRPHREHEAHVWVTTAFDRLRKKLSGYRLISPSSKTDDILERIAQWIVGQYSGHPWGDLEEDDILGFKDDAMELLELVKSLDYRPGLKALKNEKLKSIALDCFGSRDGVWPILPKSGKSIQVAMELAAKAQYDSDKEQLKGG